MSNSFDYNKVDAGKGKSYAIIGIVIVVIIIVFVFGGEIIGLLTKLFHPLSDPKGDAAQKQVDDADLSSTNPNSPFNPAMYNDNPGASTLDYSVLQSMAKNIKSAVPFILPNFMSPPDGTQMFAQFKMCNNQIDVSNLAVVFQQMYDQDLYTFVSQNLQSWIGIADSINVQLLAQIISFVKQLPPQ